MELTLLMLWTVAIFAGKGYTDVIIQQCPDGQLYVAEYSNVRLTCGPCRDITRWYVDDNSGEDRKYVGECITNTCNVDNSDAFRLNINTRKTLGFDSVLDIPDFTSKNKSFVCKCDEYVSSIYTNGNGYYVQSNDSCQLLLKVPPGSPQLQCPETVLEGSNVSCTCTSANKGSPPAQFVWDGTNTDTLLLQDVRREVNAMNYTCRQTWGRNGKFNRVIVYTLRVIAFFAAENKELPSENMKGWIVGSAFAAVVAIAIIGTLFTFYIVKRRKDLLQVSEQVYLQQKLHYCHRQTPVLHHVAPSGDIYTIGSTTTSGDLNGEYVTVREIIENTTTETDMDDNLQTNKVLPDKTETRTTLKPTTKSKPTTGTGYMNVPEVPTNSVYHTVPWAVIPVQPLDTGSMKMMTHSRPR